MYPFKQSASILKIKSEEKKKNLRFVLTKMTRLVIKGFNVGFGFSFYFLNGRQDITIFLNKNIQCLVFRKLSDVVFVTSMLKENLSLYFILNQFCVLHRFL